MQQEKIFADLKGHGLRLTPAKKKIVGIFCQSATPLSAKQLLAKLAVNKTTVYREVRSLLKINILNEVDLGDGTRRYELSSLGHHHHLVCQKCKAVTEIDLKDDLSEEEKLIELKENFKVTRHRLEFFGICHNCS